MSTYDEDDDPTGGYVFGSAPPMPRQPAWDAPQGPQSSTPHPTPPLRSDGTPWTFRTAELRARVTPEPRQLRNMPGPASGPRIEALRLSASMVKRTELAITAG